MLSTREEIDKLLKTNPELVKQSIETAFKLQSEILNDVINTGNKVLCDVEEFNENDSVPDNAVEIMNNGRKQYMVIQILDEEADENYINSIKSRVSTFKTLYERFDSITADDILKADFI